jgi:hypothetical protein
VWLETSLVLFNRIARGKSIMTAGAMAEYYWYRNGALSAAAGR